MSHFVKVKTVIKDMALLRRAASNLGYLVIRDGHVRGYNNGTQKADYVLKLPGNYDVGFSKNDITGEYEVIADFWMDHISKYIGHPNAQTDQEKMGKLLQEYSKEAIVQQARNLGYVPIMEKNHDSMLEMRFSNGE